MLPEAPHAGGVMSRSAGFAPARPPAPAAAPLGYAALDGPLAVAHRGGLGPVAENTLPAFQRSVALGVRHLEVDVRLTLDGICVAVHDTDLRRLNGSPVTVASTPWPVLRRERVGGRPVLLIEDLLTTFPAHCFLLDVKDPRALSPLVGVIRRTGALRRICLGGLSDQGVANAESVLGAGCAAMGRQSMIRLGLAALTGRRPRGIRPARFVHVPSAALRPSGLAARWLQASHEIGADVLVYTVNDAPTMHHLLDAGFDGIITDRPDLLLEVLINRDQWPPAR
jgi:glycerophosphoryl diester phosphodiesterase